MIETHYAPGTGRANPEWEEELIIAMAEASAIASGPGRIIERKAGAQKDEDGWDFMEFVRDLITFAGGFSGSKDQRANRGDFRVQYIQAMGDHFGREWKGFAWVFIAYRSTFMVLETEVKREGGAAGVLIPVFGARVLELGEGSGQVVLKVLPIGGNRESVKNLNLDWIDGEKPDTGRKWEIFVRPSAEIEAQARGSDSLSQFTVGVRMLYQPRITDPSDFNLMGEAYLRFRWKDPGFGIPELNIVPRCMVDFAGGDALQPLFQSISGRELDPYAFSDLNVTCGLNAEIGYPKRKKRRGSTAGTRLR